MDTYSRRLETLEFYGFVQEKGNINNGKYAFMYHQIDTDEMTDEDFEKFINIVKQEL